MVDALGWRCKVGLLTVASDGVAQPECEAMRPVGVTNHTARLVLGENDTNAAARPGLGPNLTQALERVMSPYPDRIVFADAMALLDADAASDLRRRIETQFNRPCTTAVEALPAALAALQCSTSIAVVSGLGRDANSAITAFFASAGFDVLRITGPEDGATALTIEEVRQQMLAADGADVSALVLLGQSIAVGHLAAEAEHWLGKPVITLTTAVYWHALRQHGIADKVAGFGALLERQ